MFSAMTHHFEAIHCISELVLFEVASNDSESGKSKGKRGATADTASPSKRQKTGNVDKTDSTQAELPTPRRSSRAVVPNSRYKDMLDPLKKQTPPLGR